MLIDAWAPPPESLISQDLGGAWAPRIVSITPCVTLVCGPRVENQQIMGCAGLSQY